MGRVLNSLGVRDHKPDVRLDGYEPDNHGSVSLYYVVPRDGLTAESLEQALCDNVNFFAQGIVLSTHELYTRGISGSQKYETVVE